MKSYPLLAVVLLSVLLSACGDATSGGPQPLENPAVFQSRDVPSRTHIAEIVLQPGERTEVKAIMDKDQVILYQWMSNAVPVYSDFHGHDPDDDSYWLRYREQGAAISSYGSLVAPITGEHGWYYRNDSDREVVISLRVSGYFQAVEDYGIFDDPEPEEI